MITPSKTIPFKSSVIFKMMFILDRDFEVIPVLELYKETKNHFSGLEEFIYAVDVLYILGKVDVDPELGKISKC